MLKASGRHIRHTAARLLAKGAGLLALLCLTACSWMEDDRSDCGESFRMDYQLRLVTNMTTELETVLNTEYDVPLQMALRGALKDVFTDYARDVDLSFYGTDSLRHVHETHEMNANEASYSIYLPIEEYMHLALANMAHQQQVVVSSDERCPSSFLNQTSLGTPPEWERALGVVGNISDSHAIGLFTARQPMHVLGSQDQTFNVRLYMANCAMALVVDTTGYAVSDLHVYAGGLADGFLVRDSVYMFRYSSLVRTFPVNVSPYLARTRADASYQSVCFCGVGFPSRDVPVNADTGTYWHLRAYVMLPDGSITENLIAVHEPLPAGHLKIVRCHLTDKGVLVTSSPEVGISVTLDWKPGTIFRPDVI